MEQCMTKNVSTGGKFNILFLHHSTGFDIYKGGRKQINIFGRHFGQELIVPKWFDDYNQSNVKSYQIIEQVFPKSKPYGWNNFPYDYYNIWVKHAGEQPYLEEPTLEMLTKKYDMIIFKHCFPVSDIAEDLDKPDIESPEKKISNYKFQYQALKMKLLQFPHAKFLLWTGAARIEQETSPAAAARANLFFQWVRNEWDTENDNIYLWDFYELETDGGLYLKKEYADASRGSHPGKVFASRAAPIFCQRVMDVIENNGTKTTITGILK